MNVEGFINEIRQDPRYADQVVHVHKVDPCPPSYAPSDHELSPKMAQTLSAMNIQRLYSHQAEAIRFAEQGHDVLITTGTASGKTLCYTLPLIETLYADPGAKALLLFPTKALCQDQFKGFSTVLEAAGLSDRMAGVFDGDTPSGLRRKLRDHASVIFSNPDMIHAVLMAQHARWAAFLGQLRMIVLDELHTYSGIFGSNMALVLRRFFRLCRHYGSVPQIVACSATIANPKELADQLTERQFQVIDRDGSPRGAKTYVFWNPPKVRRGDWRSRRSANVEAHELMAKLIERNVPTITFSKAKMTAEVIQRYVSDQLRRTAPGKAPRVATYRGGYQPEERREIEGRLFNGELLGVSTTRALELGIDVGSLEACIIVGYPGTRAAFFQQAGRAGRTEEASVVFLVGLDTSVNQYVMSSPDYVFGRSIEQAVIDPDNPFVATGHVRCAAYEMPISDEEAGMFGPHAEMVLRVLSENMKLKKIDHSWYHAASETPNHEVSLRNYADANVAIHDVDTGAVLGEVNKYDAEPIVHPGAVYMHRGETYIVLNLDLDRRLAQVKRQEVDYYTQPLGGTDIHHIDNRLREKDFGTGKAYWGEVTADFNTHGYEKIHFYSLDSFAAEDVALPTLVLETMAVWIVPPEGLMEEVRLAGLDAGNGLRAIGYATRMLLPLFMTCDTLDFSHSIGCVNAPWNTIFIYERYPHGLGFTLKVYDLLDRIMPRVLDNIKQCTCKKGCPCCVGKPLRQYATWDVQRGEASIPKKAPAIMILEGLLSDRTNLVQEDQHTLTGTEPASNLRLEQALRRRLERMREPEVFHPIDPLPQVRTGYPDAEEEQDLAKPDVAKRQERRRDFDRNLQRRIAKRIAIDKLPAPGAGDSSLEIAKPGERTVPPPGSGGRRGAVVRPTDFGTRPGPPGAADKEPVPDQRIQLRGGSGNRTGERGRGEERRDHEERPLVLGDTLAARARKRYKKKSEGEDGTPRSQ